MTCGAKMVDTNNLSVSSSTNSQRVKRICNSTLTTYNLPSLPKLHGKSTLVTTKLCEQVYKSIAPHQFDLSTPNQHIAATLLEYNSLQDPHLKSYFYHPPRKRKLKRTGFVTDDLNVVCSLKKYNAYRQFLEEEFMKIYQQKFKAQNITKQHTDSEDDIGLDEKQTTEDVHPTAREREARRRQFFLQQERKLIAKKRHLRRLKMEEEKVKQRATESKRLEREKAEMKREAELEEKRIDKLKREHEEAFKRKSAIDEAHIEEYLRLLQLHKMKQEEQVRHANELEQRWEKYERHAQLMHEEAERKKRKDEKEKDQNMQKRKKLFNLLQKREEERKQKVLQQNHYKAQLLRKEAEQFENHWKKALTEQVIECRGNMKKQQEDWNLQLRRLSQRPPSAAATAKVSSSDCTSAATLKTTDSLTQSSETNMSASKDPSLVSGLDSIAKASSEKSLSAESVSNGDVVPSLDIPTSFKSQQQISQVEASASTTGSEIGTALSCEVISSSSKTKSVRFDIPQN